MLEQPEYQDWVGQAACRNMDPALFFPTHNSANIAEARAVCFACPVLVECRTWALKHVDTVGVWGGTTERERKIMRK